MCSSKILVTSSAGNFQTAIFKFEALLSIFCGTKITLEWITSPIFRSTSHHALPIHYYWNFFNPPTSPLIIQYFEKSIPPICIWLGGEGGSNYGVTMRSSEGITLDKRFLHFGSFWVIFWTFSHIAVEKT